VVTGSRCDLYVLELSNVPSLWSPRALYQCGYDEIKMDKTPSLKPLYWVGSSKRDLRSLPGTVVDLFGYALFLA